MISEAKKYHSILADYFKQCSKSKENDLWYEKPRELPELPFL